MTDSDTSLVPYVPQVEIEDENTEPGLLGRIAWALMPSRARLAAANRAVSQVLDTRSRVSETVVMDSWQVAGEGRDLYTDGDYVGAYRRHPWVYTCVRNIATDVARLKLQILDEEMQPIQEPWPDVFQFLKRPNPTHTSIELLKAMIIDLMVIGEAFELFEGNERWWVPSWQMRVVPDRKEHISHFMLEANGKRRRFEREEVVYTRFHAPDLLVEGMSPMSPGGDTLKREGASVRYEQSLYKHNCRPSGILETDKKLSTVARKALAQEFQSHYGGHSNVGKTAVMSHGLKYTRVGMSPEEVLHLESRKLSREEIFAIFGMVPVRAGILDGATYANAWAQWDVYWHGTIFPIADLYYSALEKVIFPPGSGFHLGWTADHIETLQLAKKELYQTAVMACGGRPVLTQNQARAMIGEPPDDDPKADQLNPQPANPFAMPVDADLYAPQGEDHSADQEEVDDFEDHAEETTGEKPSDIPEQGANLDHAAMQTRAHILKRSSERTKERREAQRDREQKVCEDALAMPYLKRARKANIDALKADLKASGPIQYTKERPPPVPLAEDFVPELRKDLDEFLRGLFGRVGTEEVDELKQLKSALRDNEMQCRARQGHITHQRASAADLADFNIVAPEVLNYIAARQVQIVTVPRGTQQMVRELLMQGTEQGWTMNEMIAALNRMFDNLEVWQAGRIVRTETGGGVNEAAHQAQAQAGAKTKDWDIGHNVAEHRATHLVNADAGTINFGERFPGNGMRHPMESGFPAGEVINCMCFVTVSEFHDLGYEVVG